MYIYYRMPQKPTIVILKTVLIISLLTISTKSFTITPPCSSDDYRDLASLLVESFDEPTISTGSNARQDFNSTNYMNEDFSLRQYIIDANTQKSILPKLQFEQVTWSLYDKFLTEQYTFRQYVQTARKMKGKKYALYLAKEYNPGSVKDGSEGRPFYEVIGMIEMGMVLEPRGDSECSNFDDIQLKARATVGVLCVKPDHMNKGVGKALLNKCEQVGREIWNETQLYIEVEPQNERALQFFFSCGYCICLDKFGKEMVHIANVCRKRKVEERPHYVMSKTIDD